MEQIVQSDIERKMQAELDLISNKLANKKYDNYCDYEDEVGELIDKYCPICRKEIKNTGIGISILMADIRNYVRFKANIQLL